MEQADVVIIGAGVVGLAVARQFCLLGRDVLVLEQAAAIGTGISSRNSEVVHAGLYYTRGSLKARLCVEGRKLMRAYCDERGIDIQMCGKIVVADQQAQFDQLLKLKAQGEVNGVTDLRMLSSAEVHAREPAIQCAAGLLSPSSGIIDSHQFMLALQGDCEAHGGTIAFHSKCRATRVENDRLVITAGESGLEIAARLVINSAGLGAQAFANGIAGFDKARIPPLHLAKGSYFSLSGKAPFSRLVYPMPEPGGLGIHFTLDLAGAGRFGPDVQWIDEENYDVDPSRADLFCQSIARYWPGVTRERLQPAYVGIRPKVARPGGSHTDFIIEGPQHHGCPGLINLFGIESPGLTSCLAIARHVAEMDPL